METIVLWRQFRKISSRKQDYSSKMIFYGSLIISIFLIVLSSVILAFFGSEFVSGKYILIILVFGQIINSITGSVGIFLSMTGNEKVLRNILVISTFAVLIAYIIVMPFFGSLGAAIIMFLGSCFVNIPAVLFAKKKLNYITYYRPLK